MTDASFIVELQTEIDNGEYDNAIELLRIYMRDIRDCDEDTDYHIEQLFEEKLKLLMRIKDECFNNKTINSAKYFCECICKKVCIKVMKTAHLYSDKDCIDMYKFISYYYSFSLDKPINVTPKEQEFLKRAIAEDTG